MPKVNRKNIEEFSNGKKVELAFPTFFSKSKIVDDFKQNAFTKYFIYEEKSNIIGVVNYYDLYDRFELSYILLKFYTFNFSANGAIISRASEPQSQAMISFN